MLRVICKIYQTWRKDCELFLSKKVVTLVLNGLARKTTLIEGKGDALVCNLYIIYFILFEFCSSFFYKRMSA